MALLTCVACREEIPRMIGMTRVDSVLTHYLEAHPELLDPRDRQQLSFTTHPSNR
jgi:hypothetical protein